MGAADSWSLESISRSGEIVVEVLACSAGRALSIDTPNWSLEFRLLELGLIRVAQFLQGNAGQAKFAECVAGSFQGNPVWLVNDGEFADRMWLRIGGNGQLAEFLLVGNTAKSFAAAVAEVADNELKHEHWQIPGGGRQEITHLPTGISVSCEYTDAPIRQVHVQLMDELTKKVADHFPNQDVENTST